VAGKVPKKLNRKCDTPERALGALITKLRLQRGYSSDYMAHKIGCTAGYMDEMEHGKRNPTFRLLQAIADIHNLKLSQLIARAERKHAKCPKKKG